jgi:hypothetical protein
MYRKDSSTKHSNSCKDRAVEVIREEVVVEIASEASPVSSVMPAIKTKMEAGTQKCSVKVSALGFVVKWLSH